MPFTATVVTSTIGRPELRQCIESVRAQAYPVRHHVYVNGPKYHAGARAVLSDYPDVSAFYMPEETGDYGTGGSMADVFAAAPFLTRSDWVFYLNDDDWYDPTHVESVLELASAHDLKWAYSLRRLVRKDGAPIVDDDWCSLGHYPVRPSADQFCVDNSCFAVKRELAQSAGRAWTALPDIADRCFLAALKASGERAGCTGLVTVNYRTGTGTAPDQPEAYLEAAEKYAVKPAGGFPWRKPEIFW